VEHGYKIVIVFLQLKKLRALGFNLAPLSPMYVIAVTSHQHGGHQLGVRSPDRAEDPFHGKTTKESVLGSCAHPSCAVGKRVGAAGQLKIPHHTVGEQSDQGEAAHAARV